jgi:hypothetical protein
MIYDNIYLLYTILIKNYVNKMNIIWKLGIIIFLKSISLIDLSLNLISQAIYKKTCILLTCNI